LAASFSPSATSVLLDLPEHPPQERGVLGLVRATSHHADLPRPAQERALVPA
jgi:hypothetical protein